MAEIEIKDLAYEVSAAGRFVQKTLFSEDAKDWFAYKVVAYLLKKVGNDREKIRTTALAVIQRATDVVSTRIDAIGGFSTVPDEQYDLFEKHVDTHTRKRLRAQIIYGAIGVHPDVFLSLASDVSICNCSLLDFIVERRFRAVVRMEWFVNDKTDRLLFICAAERDIKNCAKPYWKPVNQAESPDSWEWERKDALVLSRFGKAEPKAAIEYLFQPPSEFGGAPICETANVLGCALTATIVHMDALLVGSAPTQLAIKLVGEGEEYIAIDHPMGSLRREPFGTKLKGGTVSRLKEEVVITSPSTNVDVEVTRPWYIATKGEPNNGFLSLGNGVTCQIVEGRRSEKIEIDGIWCSGSLENRTYTGKIRVREMNQPGYSRGARIVPEGIPPFHFITDSSPEKGLFEQKDIVADDLQVGDHIYVRNHPLVVWTGSAVVAGEHAFVTQCWLHFSVSETMVSGSGMSEQSIRSMSKHLFEDVNLQLKAARDIVGVYRDLLTAQSPEDWTFSPPPTPSAMNHILDFTLTNITGKSILDLKYAEVPLLNGKWIVWVLRGKLCWYLFTMEQSWIAELQPGPISERVRELFPGEYRPTGEAQVEVEQEGLKWVISDVGSKYLIRNDESKLKVFLQVNEIGHEDWILPEPGLPLRFAPINISYNEDLVQLNDLKKQYCLSFFNQYTGRIDYLSLYYPAGHTRRGGERCITYDDMQPIELEGSEPGMIFCTRPRVDASPEYLEYLRQLGAIAQ